MTKIKTPVTIYTNGNGCKWINDAEGEAVDFVTVADALNRTADLKALVAENEALKEQVDGLKNAINSALRESADIREGIRTGQARDLVIIDNSFYVIEDGLQIALATHGGNDGQR